MLIPNRLVAKTKGKQVAGSLYQAHTGEYFLASNAMVQATNEVANALYHTLCVQGLCEQAQPLTDEEIHYIVHLFKRYTCVFIDNIWVEIKK